MITLEALQRAGYVAFHDPTAVSALGPYYRQSYQRWISDSYTRYAITIRYGIWPARDGDPERPFFAPGVQFLRGPTTFNVDVLHHEETLAEVEALFAEIWNKMSADYYERDERSRR